MLVTAELEKFVNEQGERLNTKFGLSKGSRETLLAHLAKLMEESGELSEAILSYFGYQREEKELAGGKEEIEEELADVVFSCFIMAESLGLDIDKLLSRKAKKLRGRR